MSKLLEDAIRRLRKLPEPLQDTAARAIIRQIEEEPEPGDREAVEQGREDYRRGNFITLEEWRRRELLSDEDTAQ